MSEDAYLKLTIVEKGQASAHRINDCMGEGQFEASPKPMEGNEIGHAQKTMPRLMSTEASLKQRPRQMKTGSVENFEDACHPGGVIIKGGIVIISGRIQKREEGAMTIAKMTM